MVTTRAIQLLKLSVSKLAMDQRMRQLKQERQGVTPKASPLTSEQIEIRELKKRIAELEEHNEIIKEQLLC